MRLSRLNASKMIMRPERVREEPHDACLEQTDSQYDEGVLQESEPVPENASPHRRAEVRNRCDDDYGSRLVARPARAIQCGWHQGHRRVYTPGTTDPSSH